jgi:[protein-PII] uridylyltransferase
VKNPDQLKMLYLLTFADVKAVGPEAWTSWKDSLLAELFLKSSHFFEREAATGQFPKEDEKIEKLRTLLSSERGFEEVDSLPDRYLLSYSEKEIVHHMEMARSLGKQSICVEWETEEKRRARVTVCTKDCYGLFFKIAGSMFFNRLNVLEAQIHTWANGVALDTFSVEDSTQEIERRLQQFKKDLEAILTGKTSLKDLLSQRKESNGLQKKVMPKVPVELKVNNDDSGFFTIIEVTGEDRLGILYEITQALTDHGCNIHFARISTLGNRIVDVFYVQNTWGEKIEGESRIDLLRQTLLGQLSSGKGSTK